jgi:hypothetical protein
MINHAFHSIFTLGFTSFFTGNVPVPLIVFSTSNNLYECFLRRSRTKKPAKEKALFAGGFPAPLPENTLPTHGDVARYFYQLQQEKKWKTSARITAVAKALEDIWQRCCPTVPTVRTLLRHKVDAFLQKVNRYNGKPYKPYMTGSRPIYPKGNDGQLTSYRYR